MVKEMTEPKQPLAWLEGRPIHVGDTLYGLDGEEFEASATGHRDYPMAMIVKSSVRGNLYRSWLTDTHWKGQQVLFWSKADIPAPKDRTLYSRLTDQIAARRKRGKR
jgi:hypothetical protein